MTVYRVYDSDWFVDWLTLSVVRAEDDLIVRVASVQVCGTVKLGYIGKLLTDVRLLCRPNVFGTLLHILLSRFLLFGSSHCCCIVSGCDFYSVDGVGVVPLLVQQGFPPGRW